MRKRDLARESLAPVRQEVDLPALDAAVLETELRRGGSPADRLGLVERFLPALASGIDDLALIDGLAEACLQPGDVARRVSRRSQRGPPFGHRPAADEDRAAIDQLQDAAGLAGRSHVVDQHKSREVVGCRAVLLLEPGERIRAGPVDGVVGRSGLIRGY